MKVTLELAPELEAALAARPGARGLPLADYLQTVIVQSLQTLPPLPHATENLAAALDALAQGADLPPVPTHFFGRRSIYSRHD